jgi:hypothetical protein
MVPLTTLQGMPAAEIRRLAGGRRLLVWGCGDLALDVVTSLRKAGLAPAALLHSAPAAAACPFSGLPLLAADAALAAAADGTRPFVVLAAAAFFAAAERACRDAGLVKGLDFVSHFSIARPQAIVEITGADAPAALMPLPFFAAIVDKLGREQPLLTRLEFGLAGPAGDPLAHPELPAMLRLAGHLAPCTVVTRLAGGLPLAPLVAAAPARVDIAVSGFAGSYEAAGAADMPWRRLVERIAELRREIAAQRPATRFVLRLYRRRHGHAADLSGWRELLRGSGIELAVHTPYLMPYEEVLDRCRRGVLSAPAAAAAESLPWSVDRVLAACAADAQLPCLSQRMFPVIRHDGAVALCHLYFRPRVADNYLTTGWDELIERRHAADFCRECQGCGLHRLDVEVLARRHPQQDFTAFPET